MPLPDDVAKNRLELVFGAGINSAETEDGIHDSECADGSENFDLQLNKNEFFRRKAFDLIATAPNGQINGYAQLVDDDGTITTLIQSGDTVYSWDGETTFTSVGTVAAGARLRGPSTAHWPLDGYVIITDLELLQPVMKWDGTTFSAFTHNLGGSFFAKYCVTQFDRAWFANVISGTATPHLICASEIEDASTLSITNRPAPALAPADPFFLTAPNFTAINSIIGAFGLLTFSTESETLYNLTGSNAEDYALTSLYDDSGATGDEPMAYGGNDIYYGRQGRIETMFATFQLGDVGTDDPSRPISNLITDFAAWTVAYNPRYQKLYFFSEGNEYCLVFAKDFIDERSRKILQQKDLPERSPWAVWTTDHSFGFRPTCVIPIRRPSDGLFQVYMGDSTGRIFMLEGDGGQDGGTTDITATRVSKSYAAPAGTIGFNIGGYISWRKLNAITLTMTMMYGGVNVYDETLTLSLPGADGVPYFGSPIYFGGTNYFGIPFEGRFARVPFNPSGKPEQFQVKFSVAGAEEFFIHKAYIEFKSAG